MIILFKYSLSYCTETIPVISTLTDVLFMFDRIDYTPRAGSVILTLTIGLKHFTFVTHLPFRVVGYHPATDFIKILHKLDLIKIHVIEL